MNWIRQTAGGAVLSVKVVPRARRSEVAGPHGDALRVRLAAPPVDNKANRALVEFLAGLLGTPAGRVEIAGGQASRDKRVLLHGVDAAAAARVLWPE